MKFRNFTPHTITIFAEDSETVLLELPSEGSIRIEENETAHLVIGGIPVVEKEYLPVELPVVQEGEGLIVSKMVLDAIYENYQYVAGLFCPDTGPNSVVRDASGKILGVRRLQR